MTNTVRRLGGLLIVVSFGLLARTADARDTNQLEFIKVSKDGRQFVRATSGRKFIPWGFNYDHDRNNRLLEQYWNKSWPDVVSDFEEMKQLGANVVRIHLQVG